MSLLASLPQTRPTVDLSKTVVSYVPPVSYDLDVTPLEILEAKKVIGSGPNTGLRTWEAALRLAYYLHSKPGLVQDRQILELGAGTGFLSIFCASFLQPSSMLVTDGHEDVLTSLQVNIQRNSTLYYGIVPKAQKLFWGDEEDIRSVPQDIDLVIGADITYEPGACVDLAKTLSSLASRNPKLQILISATQRNLETLNVFLTECRSPKNNLRVDGVPLDAIPFDKQTGLFHNIVSPIQIFDIRSTHVSTT
jgi:protein-lysine N-methyltransferase EEF2KMT